MGNSSASSFCTAFPLSTKACFPASIFVRVVNTVLGELCLLLLPKKFPTMGHLFWLVGRKFAFSVSLGDGEYEEYLLREL